MINSDLIGNIIWPLTSVIIVAIISTTIYRLLQGSRASARDYNDSSSQLKLYTYNVSKILAAARFASAVVAMRYEKGLGQYEFAKMDSMVKEFLKKLLYEDESTQRTQLCILWAHKEDFHDQFEKQTFEDLGFSVDFCHSTKTAIEYLLQKRYDILISNMGRLRDERRPELGEDEEAAFELLEKAQNVQRDIPFIIYSRHITPERTEKAAQYTMLGCTSDPETLFLTVLKERSRLSKASDNQTSPAPSP